MRLSLIPYTILTSTDGTNFTPLITVNDPYNAAADVLLGQATVIRSRSDPLVLRFDADRRGLSWDGIQRTGRLQRGCRPRTRLMAPARCRPYCGRGPPPNTYRSIWAKLTTALFHPRTPISGKSGLNEFAIVELPPAGCASLPPSSGMARGRRARFDVLGLGTPAADHAGTKDQASGASPPYSTRTGASVTCGLPLGGTSSC